MNRLIALLRIARRDALRAKGRSALIIAMIAVPIMLATAGDIVAQSSTTSSEQQARIDLGSADAIIRPEQGFIVRQDIAGNVQWGESSPDRLKDKEFVREDIQALLPGSEVVTETTEQVVVETRDSIHRVDYKGLDYAKTAGQGRYPQVEGRTPAGKDEVSISPELSKITRARIGDEISLADPVRKVKVVAIVRDPQNTKSLLMVGQAALEEDKAYEPTYRVKASQPFTWEMVKAANAKGALVTSKHVLDNPPPKSQLYPARDELVDVYGLGLGALIAFVIVGEVALLAGTAFAVGARRQRRTLALVSATGGTKGDLRSVVLAGAIVLGAVASVIGVLGGIGLALVASALIEHYTGTVFVDFEIPTTHLALIVLVGVASALIAALLPARAAASINVSAALAGRPDPKSRKQHSRLVKSGLVLVAIGLGGTVIGSVVRNIAIVGVAALAVEVGAVMATPALVSFVSRVGKHLPITPRIALRDASRNNQRTSPSVGAIMAGVAGAVTISMYVGAIDINDEKTYTPEALHGQVIAELQVSSAENNDTAVDGQKVVSDALRQHLPVKAITPVRYAYAKTPQKCRDADRNDTETMKDCPMTNLVIVSPETQDTSGAPGNSDLPTNQSMFWGNIAIGNEEAARAFIGDVPPAAAEQLKQGGAITLNRTTIANGKLKLAIEELNDSEFTTVSSGSSKTIKQFELPAVAVEPTYTYNTPAAIISPETANRLDLLDSFNEMLIVDTTRMPTKGEEAKAQKAVNTIADLSVERGYPEPYKLGKLALGVTSALIALLATSIATGLALADGARDQATMSAVGGGPLMRRKLSAFQAMTVATIGAVLGIAVGIVPGAAIAWLSRYDYDGISLIHTNVPWAQVIPWTTIALVLIVVPILGAVSAWLFTRSHVDFTRRAV